jgi:Na+/melibiose symporter-like transporter
MTLYSIPSASMLPEITSHYDERTSLVSYRMLFGWAGGLTISLLGYLYFFAANGEQDGRLNAEAYGTFAAVCAVFVFVAILVSSLGTHRLIPTLRDPPDKTPFTLKRFAREARDVASDRSYLMVVIGALFASVAGGFNDVVGLYVNTYFWEFSTDQIAIMVFGLGFSVLLATGLTRPITERFDKRTALMGLAIFSVFFGPAPVFLRLLDLMPSNGHPALLPIIMAHAIILVWAIISTVIIVSSMVADTVDQNELRTGKRQEGMAISAIAFSTKATSGIGGLLAGIALDVIAFPRLADPGSVPPDKVFLLGLAIGPGMMGLYLIMLFFFSRYRITRDAHHETLRALEERHAAGAAAEPPVDRAAS